MAFLLRKTLSISIKSCFLTRSISTSSTKCIDIPLFKRMGTAQQNYFLKDNMPKEFQLIYRAPMESYIHWSINVSTLSAALISGLALYRWASDNFSNLRTINFDRIASKEEDIWYFAAGFVMLNLITRYFVTKYALRIYKNADKYVAVYVSQVPLRLHYNQFQRGSVSPSTLQFHPWAKAMYRLGNKNSLLLLDYFKTPAEFHRMCKPANLIKDA